MTRGMRLLLSVALALLGGGITVSLSGDPVAPALTVLLPAGVIALGMFLIAWIMRGEMARFDEEERRKHERLEHRPSALAKSGAAQEHYGAAMDAESGISHVH